MLTFLEISDHLDVVRTRCTYRMTLPERTNYFFFATHDLLATCSPDQREGVERAMLVVATELWLVDVGALPRFDQRCAASKAAAAAASGEPPPVPESERWTALIG